MNKQDLLKELQALLDESIRLYESNNRGAYEAGRVDGVKWCIEKVKEVKE